jgi:hypothetical protein
VETQGILYVATGAKYIRAAIHSAETVREHSPGLATHLYADWQRHGFDFHASPRPFTSVASIERPHRRSKVDYIPRTPFDRTLFLDTDTALNADVRGLFQILDRFDIAIAHAHRRNAAVRLRPWRIQLPQAFPQFNAGVILYRRTPAVDAFLEDWRRSFHEAGFQQDQITLRELLWLSDLRIATLPPEFNVRFIKYHFLWAKEEAISQIFHRRRYHDGRWWVLNKWLRRLGRPLVRMGIDPRTWWRTDMK